MMDRIKILVSIITGFIVYGASILLIPGNRLLFTREISAFTMLRYIPGPFISGYATGYLCGKYSVSLFTGFFIISWILYYRVINVASAGSYIFIAVTLLMFGLGGYTGVRIRISREVNN